VGWRMFRRITIAPGVRVNISRSGPSLSIGPRGFKKTFSRRGVRTTVGIPGTGVYHTDLEPWEKTSAPGRSAGRTCPACGATARRDASFCWRCGRPV
jgi:hypothetical protein